ncbi:MAG: PAS domain S-box protein [Candidatus Acidiferrales bacterium]
MDFLRQLFGSGDFRPHGYCYLWNSRLVWLHVSSDVLIALAYFTIPITLAWFIRKRRDLPFSWIFVCFGIFIVACGGTHVMEVWNLWHANYWLAGALKAVTAAASLVTAVLLVTLMPRALDLPSPTQWIHANAALEKEVHDRRELELNLRISESNYREQAELLELTHDAIFVRSLDKKIIYWNRAAERLYGWQKEEVRGKITHELLHTAFPKPLNEIQADIFEKGYWEGELTHTRRDGSTVAVSSRWALRVDAAGKPVSILESNRDITHRKQEEEKFRNLLESAPDAIVIVDHSGRIQLVNAQTEKLFGYPRQELLGERVEILVPQHFHGEHSAHRDEYSQSPRPREMGAGLELYGRRKDGTEFPAEISLSPLETGEGTLTSSAIRDVSDRKRVAEALKASEERLQMAVEAAQLGVWDLDLGTDRAFRSLRHDQIFGYDSLQPVWGAEIALAHVVPEDREAFRSSFEDAFESSSFATECRINRSSDRSVRWISAQGRVYRDPGGKPTRLMGVVADITERKQAELELELHRRDLARSNADLAALNRELEAFSYSVSHDLRAPLRHIDGFARILKEEHAAELSSEAHRYLDRILHSATLMGQLVDDLLNLARIGRKELVRQRTRLDDLVREVLAHLPETANRSIEWRVEPLPEVDCDPGLLKLVFNNLLANALKFTRDCQPAVIEIGTHDVAGVVTIFVRDNGVGFDPKYADKLFGVFQRLHRQEDFEGTGVGLATVQRIIHRHGGEVWADSEVEHGATFFFSLCARPVSTPIPEPVEANHHA